MRRSLVAISIAALSLGCGARRGVDAGEAPPSMSVTDATTPSHPDGGVALADAGERPPPSGSGSVSGTAFWLGSLPGADARRPLHFGDAHPGDWEGAADAEIAALEDVVVGVVPVRNPSATSPPTPASWPEIGVLSCSSTQCPPYVTVASGDRLELLNFTRNAVTWHLVKDGRVRQTIGIFASRTDPPAVADISGLEPGVYEIIERGSTERRGWLYRAADDEIVVGPTRGNCRFSIALTPGSYRVVTWHPHLSPVEKPVDIRAGVIKRVNPVFTDRHLHD